MGDAGNVTPSIDLGYAYFCALDEALKLSK